MKTKYSLLFFIIIFLSTAAFSQSLTWAKSIGSSDEDNAAQLFTDAWGNIYMIGSYQDNIDMDPDAGEFILDVIGLYTPFIAKYNPEGELVWAYRIPEDFYFGISYVGSDDEGNFYLAGDFFISFNPDFIEGTTPLSGLGVNQIWFAKYDPAFHIVWAHALPAIGEQYVYGGAVDDNGNMYLTGTITDTVDFDPSADTVFLKAKEVIDSKYVAKYNTDGELVLANLMNGDFTNDDKLIVDKYNNLYFMSSGNGYEGIDLDLGPGEMIDTLCGYFVKYDSASNYLWHIPVDCSNFQDFNVDTTGNIYFIGTLWDSMDLDPGPDTAYTLLLNAPDDVLAKYDTNGNFIWSKVLGGTGNCSVYDMLFDNELNIYLAGYFTNDIDFDPGAGTYIPFTFTQEGMIGKYTGDGNFISLMTIGGSYASDEKIKNIILTETNDIICTGTFDNLHTDFDPGDSIYNIPYNDEEDIFLAKYAQGPCSETYLLIDSLLVMNCSHETGYAHAVIHGVPPYTYSWNTDPPVFSDSLVIHSPGVYELNAHDSAGCYFDRFILVSGPLSFDSSDLNIILTSTVFAPNTYGHTWLYAYNDGCFSEDGSITCTIDPDLEYISAVPEPDMIDGNVLSWNFSDLYYENNGLLMDIKTHTPITLGFGDSVTFIAKIQPFEHDIDTVNNTKEFKRNILAAYDPNIKDVYPGGWGNDHIITANTLMTYGIHFQNTGNYPAKDIYILDTLDGDLDLHSLRIVQSSHDVHTEILNDSVIKFIFNDIFLADSISDEAHSHGFLSYEMMHDSLLPDGTVINNSAAIFFDYNPPVLTNTVFNTIGEIPLLVSDPEIKNIHVYPNPATDVLYISGINENYDCFVYDTHGKLWLQYHGHGMGQFPVNNLPQGLYIYTVSSASYSLSNMFLVIK